MGERGGEGTEDATMKSCAYINRVMEHVGNDSDTMPFMQELLTKTAGVLYIHTCIKQIIAL